MPSANVIGSSLLSGLFTKVSYGYLLARQLIDNDLMVTTEICIFLTGYSKGAGMRCLQNYPNTIDMAVSIPGGHSVHHFNTRESVYSSFSFFHFLFMHRHQDSLPCCSKRSLKTLRRFGAGISGTLVGILLMTDSFHSCYSLANTLCV